MDQIFLFVKRFQFLTKNVDLLVAFGLLMVLGVMIIPLPPFILDLTLTASLASSILILLVAFYIKKPLEFSVFPTILLMATLYRLALNVATTRLILSHGHEGGHAAGEVISSFGQFVIGNNYIIGAVVFVILVIINFIVITKGSGRVAEVAARFTLDAMPGKQMSIDADLNAGIINEAEAKRRRQEIEAEADFYGAMDGASKFVRGDAIAGIIITIVNIVGGFFVGMIQHNLDIVAAAKTYTILTIGDGLLVQIPALIVSTAAGIVVTRSSRSSKNVSSEIVGQLFINPKALAVSGGIIGLLAIIPGLPKLPFIVVGGFLGGLAWTMDRFQKEAKDEEEKKAQESALAPKKENIEGLLSLELIELEVGYGLIDVVENDKSGDLLERIASIRKQFAIDLGIIVPSVHIRDNLQLEPGEYRVLVKGSKVGGGVLRADSLLAMDPGNTTATVEGSPTKEPAFGLDALWISPNAKDRAEEAGYTVVDLPTVIATHLTEIIRNHSYELLGRQEAASLIDNFKKAYPKVVEDLMPDPLNLGAVVRVLQSLLKERISIRDLRTIFESLADEAHRTKDTEILTEGVRKSLSRQITEKLVDENGNVFVITLHPQVEELISNSLLQTESGVQLVMDPQSAQGIISDLATKIEAHPEIAANPILLVSPTARRHLFKLISRFIPQVSIVSHSEITQDAKVKSVGIVEISHAS